MALYNVVVKDRTNEATLYDFGGATPEVTALTCENLRRIGCSSASFTVCRTDFSAVESLLVGANIVEISFDFGSGSTLTWSGRITRVDKADNTTPKNKIRTVECKGFWHDLTNPGCKVLKAWSTSTATTSIAMGLIVSPISAETGIELDLTGVTASDPYFIDQTLFEDQPAADCIKKLAEVNNDTVYGVDEDRRLYFRDETAEGAAAMLTFQQGTTADAVKMFDRKEDWSKCVNHYIVEGRDAESGNPCTMESYDSALDSDATLPWSTKVVKAPDLVTGADLKQWADYLVARDKDPKIQAKLSIADISTKLATPLLCETLNGNIAVDDTGGSEIGKYQAQAIKYTLTGGVIAATIEIGNELCRDEVDALGFRDLLRDMAAQSMKEFSNGIEVASWTSDWRRDAHITMAGNGLRNDWRAEITDCHKDDSIIDFDHEDTTGIKRTTRPVGITSKTLDTSGATFVTRPIAVRGDFPTWAALRHMEGKTFFDDAPQSDKDAFFTEAYDSTYPMSWRERDGYIVPDPLQHHTTPRDFDGRLICTTGVHPETSIVFKFKWGTPHGDGSYTYCRRYLLHHYDNNSNHYRIQLKHESGSPDKLAMGIERIYEGTTTAHSAANGYSSSYRTVNLYGEGDEIQVTIDNIDIWANDRYRVTMENLTNGQETSCTTDVNWLALSADMNRVAFRCWLNNFYFSDDSRGYDNWFIQSVSFADDPSYATDWYITRDGSTWENLYSVDTGAPKTLGLDGAVTETVRIKGKVRFPQILTDIALGWGGR